MRVYSQAERMEHCPDVDLPMKDLAPDSFPARLAALRRSRGLTQDELGRAAGSSQRMIAHYENTPDARPPADVVAALARALQVSADELLGLEPISDEVSSARYRLRKRLRKVEELPPDDQKTVLKIVDALLEKRGVA
jgi:transcriptional regulator with XRE-family HTH domain